MTQAIASQMSKEIQKRDLEDVEGVDGWDTFTPIQKRVLQVLPWFQTLDAACRYIGCSYRGMQNKASANKKLRAAIQNRGGLFRTKVAREIGADMLGFALSELQGILTNPDVKEGTRLNAIKMVLDLNNMMGKENQAAVSNTLVQAENVVMYEGARSANGNS